MRASPGATPPGTSQAPPAAPAGTSSQARLGRYRSEKFRRTIQQIREASTSAGVKDDVIKRLDIVFPDGVISRDALRVNVKLKDTESGYQLFTEQRANGRWYCQLCRMDSTKSWMNQKDISCHVWNGHCTADPSTDSTRGLTRTPPSIEDEFEAPSGWSVLELETRNVISLSVQQETLCIIT